MLPFLLLPCPVAFNKCLLRHPVTTLVRCEMSNPAVQGLLRILGQLPVFKPDSRYASASGSAPAARIQKRTKLGNHITSGHISRLLRNLGQECTTVGPQRRTQLTFGFTQALNVLGSALGLATEPASDTTKGPAERPSSSPGTECCSSFDLPGIELATQRSFLEPDPIVL